MARCDAENIRKNILAAAVPHETAAPLVTVSIGAATIVPAKGVMEGHDENADRALYAAKAGGRNKVCVDNVAVITVRALQRLRHL